MMVVNKDYKARWRTFVAFSLRERPREMGTRGSRHLMVQSDSVQSLLSQALPVPLFEDGIKLIVSFLQWDHERVTQQKDCWVDVRHNGEWSLGRIVKTDKAPAWWTATFGSSSTMTTTSPTRCLAIEYFSWSVPFMPEGTAFVVAQDTTRLAPPHSDHGVDKSERRTRMNNQIFAPHDYVQVMTTSDDDCPSSSWSKTGQVIHAWHRTLHRLRAEKDVDDGDIDKDIVEFKYEVVVVPRRRKCGDVTTRTVQCLAPSHHLGDPDSVIGGCPCVHCNIRLTECSSWWGWQAQAQAQGQSRSLGQQQEPLQVNLRTELEYPTDYDRMTDDDIEAVGESKVMVSRGVENPFIPIY